VTGFSGVTAPVGVVWLGPHLEVVLIASSLALSARGKGVHWTGTCVVNVGVVQVESVNAVAVPV